MCDMDDATLMEQQREAILRQAIADPRIAEAMKRFQEASLRVPPPVMVNTGHVRYSTGSN